MLAIAYLLAVVAVNVGFTALGPSWPVFVAVGAVLALRDFVHRAHGWKVSLALIVAGAGIAALFNLAAPLVALASVVAFLVAETLDMALFAAVRERLGLALGVLVSGLVGSLVDSLVFLSIAFGSLAFLGVQYQGKAAATVAAAAVVALARRRDPLAA